MSKSSRSARTHRGSTLADVGEIVDASRRAAARSVNAVMTATYWAVGRRIAQEEARTGAAASAAELAALAAELTARFGRGYSVRALRTMRAFHDAYANLRSCGRRVDGPVDDGGYFDELRRVAAAFPLSWSHYARLLRVPDPAARAFYEHEAFTRGWTVRELAAHIRGRLHRRAAAAQDTAAARRARRDAAMPPARPDEALRDPALRRFLDVVPLRGTGAREPVMPARGTLVHQVTHARETAFSWANAGPWLQ